MGCIDNSSTLCPKNPTKPIYTAEKKQALKTKVAEAKPVDSAALLKATNPPTKSPTPPPTKEGEEVVIEERKVSTVKATMPIAYTKKQIETPPVQKTLQEGMATTLGVDSKDVTVGEVTRRMRRLEGACEVTASGGCEEHCFKEANKCVALSKVEFVVVSKEAGTGALEKMKANIKEAAEEGSLIANIKSSAIDNGALTGAMKDMVDEVVVTTVTGTKTIEVAVVKPKPNTPPPAPASEDEHAGHDHDGKTAEEAHADGKKKNNDAVIGGAVGGVIGGLIVCGLAWVFFFKPSPPSPPSPPVPSYKVEEQLTI